MVARKSVVYILGAGFSAPLGVPVICNFLFKAREQYVQQREVYQHFKEVFSYIDSLAKIHYFLKADLYNIEEVFSIADTQDLLGKSKRELLQRFIKDVIEYHSPTIGLKDRSFEIQRQFWLQKLWEGSNVSDRYVNFAGKLMNLEFAMPPPSQNHIDTTQVVTRQSEVAEAEYHIITLNYDLIMHQCFELFMEDFQSKLPPAGEFIASLHGTIRGEIVPPSWSKAIRTSSELKAEWAKAAAWLRSANEVRILGYSMPPTDLYIRHLLATAFIDSENLQEILVLCLDPDGSVQRRFEGMFTFPRLAFENVNVSDYLGSFQEGYNLQKLSNGSFQAKGRNGPCERLHQLGLHTAKEQAAAKI